MGKFTKDKTSRVMRDFYVLEYGKNKSETLLVRAVSMADAVKAGQKGDGRKLTPEEVKEVWND